MVKYKVRLRAKALRYDFKAYEKRMSKEGVPRPGKSCLPRTQGGSVRAMLRSPPRRALGLAVRGDARPRVSGPASRDLRLRGSQPRPRPGWPPKPSRSPKTPGVAAPPQLSGSSRTRKRAASTPSPGPVPAGLTSRAPLRPDLGTLSVGTPLPTGPTAAAPAPAPERLPAARRAPPPPPRLQGSLPGP